MCARPYARTLAVRARLVIALTLGTDLRGQRDRVDGVHGAHDEAVVLPRVELTVRGGGGTAVNRLRLELLAIRTAADHHEGDRARRRIGPVDGQRIALVLG